MKKIATLIVSCIMGLGLATGASAAMVTSLASAKNTEFLFARVFKDATLTHMQGQHYQLSVAHANIDKVSAMSISPHKVFVVMSPQEYAEVAHRGPDSFDKIPPNLFIYFKGHPMKGYTLTGYKKTDGHLVYLLDGLAKSDSNEPAITGDAVLVIDDKGLNFG